MKAFISSVSLLAVLAVTVGCMTPSGRIMADNPPVPISMTRAVHGPGGEVLTEGHGYTVIKRVEVVESRLFLLYGWLGPANVDVGEAFGPAIAANQADAVVGLEANSQENISGPVTFLAELIPVWPFWWDYKVAADLVKFTNKPAPPAAEPTPPAAEPAPATPAPADASAPPPQAAPAAPAPTETPATPPG